MARSLIEIDLGSGRTGVVAIPDAVVEYFNIPLPTATNQTLIERNRKAHTRRPKNLDGTSGNLISVEASRWYSAPAAPKNSSTGQKVLVPTELTVESGATRMVTMWFPQKAVIGAISAFLHEKCVAHKPKYFQLNGIKRMVLPKGTISDINPGEEPEAVI